MGVEVEALVGEADTDQASRRASIALDGSVDEVARARYQGMQVAALGGVYGNLPQLVSHRNAVAIPPSIWRDARGHVDTTGGRPRLSGGVFSEGVAVRASAHYEGPVELMAPDVNALVPPVADLTGRWLYFGLAVEHIGHFLLESLARVWALDEPAIGGIDGVLLFLEPGISEGMPAENAALLELATGLPVHLVTTPTRVEELIVARQESLAGLGMLSSPRQVAAMRRRFRPGESGSEEMLFLSRAGLAPDSTGKILGGSELERLLGDLGVRTIRPELIPVAEQLRAYRGARLIIVEDGTPVHFVAVCASKDATVVLLPRRPWMTMLFEAHLALYLGPSATITSFDDVFPLVSPVAAPLLIQPVLDVPALRRRLALVDHVFGACDWGEVDLSAVERDRQSVEEYFSSSLVPFDPMARAAEQHSLDPPDSVW